MGAVTIGNVGGSVTGAVAGDSVVTTTVMLSVHEMQKAAEQAIKEKEPSKIRAALKALYAAAPDVARGVVAAYLPALNAILGTVDGLLEGGGGHA